MPRARAHLAAMGTMASGVLAVLSACSPEADCPHARDAQVHLLVRSKRMRASAAMQDRVVNHDKVEVHFSTEVADAFGDKKGALKGLHLRDTETGAPLSPALSCCPLARHCNHI